MVKKIHARDKDKVQLTMYNKLHTSNTTFQIVKYQQKGISELSYD